MWLMLQQEKPDVYVIATGVTHRVYDFVQEAINVAGLTGAVEDYVDFDSNMLRPAEVELLIGDPTKAREILKWEPKTTFPQLVEIMVENDLRITRNTM